MTFKSTHDFHQDAVLEYSVMVIVAILLEIENIFTHPHWTTGNRVVPIWMESSGKNWLMKFIVNCHILYVWIHNAFTNFLNYCVWSTILNISANSIYLAITFPRENSSSSGRIVMSAKINFFTFVYNYTRQLPNPWLTTCWLRDWNIKKCNHD